MGWQALKGLQPGAWTYGPSLQGSAPFLFLGLNSAFAHQSSTASHLEGLAHPTRELRAIDGSCVTQQSSTRNKMMPAAMLHDGCISPVEWPTPFHQ